MGRGVATHLGWDVSDFLGDADFWASQIHTDDRERTLSCLAGLSVNDHCRMEYRFRQEDGSCRWIGDAVRLERDACGKPARIVGCWTDVTASRAAGQTPGRDEERFRTIFDNMAETYYRVGPDGLVTMVSPAVGTLLGFTPDEAVGLELAGLYADPEGRGKFLAAVAAGNGSVRDYRAELRRKDGSTVWVSTNARYVRDAAGDVPDMIGKPPVFVNHDDRWQLARPFGHGDIGFHFAADAVIGFGLGGEAGIVGCDHGRFRAGAFEQRKNRRGRGRASGRLHEVLEKCPSGLLAMDVIVIKIDELIVHLSLSQFCVPG